MTRSLLLMVLAFGTALLPAAPLRAQPAGWSGSATYALELFANVDGGRETGSASAGLLNLGADYAGARFSFHANAYLPHGSEVTDIVGDFSVVSNIFTVDLARLQELWFEFPIAQRSSLRAGMLAVDTEFWGTAHGALFVNSAFGAATFASGNLPNSPIFPTAAAGLRFATTSRSGLTVRTALLDGDAGDPESENRHGWDVTLDEGALLLAEALWSRPSRFGGSDVYRFSAYGHSGEFESVDARPVSGSWGCLVALERALSANVGWFARAGFAARDRSAAPAIVETGIVLAQAGGRPGALGFAAAWVELEERLTGLVESGDSSGSETILEISYGLPLGLYVTMQPDAQLILTPGGDAAISHALVLGLRAKVHLDSPAKEPAGER